MASGSSPFAKIPLNVAARTDIGASTKLVHTMVVDESRGRPEWAVGLRRLRRLTGCSINTIRKALAELELTGLLVVSRSGSGQRNRYSLSKESVSVSDTVPKPRAYQFLTRGVSESDTEAHQNLIHDQTQTVFQTTPSTGRGVKCTQSTDHQRLIRYFGEEWARLVGGGAAYQFAGPKDGKAARRILEAAGSLDRAKRMVDLYLADSDAWLTEHGTGRGLALLASNARLTKYLALSGKRAGPSHRHHIICQLVQACPQWATEIEESIPKLNEVGELIDTGQTTVQEVIGTMRRSPTLTAGLEVIHNAGGDTNE